MTCSEQIKAHRLKADLTVSELAHKAGLKPEYLAGLEEKDAQHPIIDLMRIAQALKIPTFSLFRDEPVKEKEACSRPAARKRETEQPL